MPSNDRPLIWERLDRTPRGPRPSMSHDQIVEAAVEIADAEGLDAVSMRRLAKQLDAGTMSLYRYVANRDDLIELMTDYIAGEDAPTGPPSGDWRHELAEAARRTRRLALRHPWSTDLMLGLPALGPNSLRQMERALAGVDGLGLSIDQMTDLTSTVTAFVIGFAQAELAQVRAQQRTGLTEEQYRDRMAPYLGKQLETGRFPYTRRLIVEAEDFPDVDTVFERRLGYVLDGLAASLPAPPEPNER
jgi:AcrR family transcriptional regulator